MLKKLILLLMIPCLLWSYDVPIQWNFKYGGWLQAPDSVWVVYSLDGTKQDSTKYTSADYSTEFFYETVVDKSGGNYDDTSYHKLNVRYNFFGGGSLVDADYSI